MNITRRECFKLAGSLAGLGLINALSGCEKEETSSIKYDENGVKNLSWKATGNSKQFDVGEHFIYTMVSIYDKDNGQIIIPEGYEYVSSETFYRMYDVKYNFVNTVPVVALEYKNKLTGEIAFPYSGTPIQLENERQKTLS